MELGGNIELINFENLDHSKLIVIKKIVGNYAKKMSDIHGFEKLSLSLKDETEIQGRLTINKKIHSSEARDDNLFFALDKVLSNLYNECKSL